MYKVSAVLNTTILYSQVIKQSLKLVWCGVVFF